MVGTRNCPPAAKSKNTSATPLESCSISAAHGAAHHTASEQLEWILTTGRQFIEVLRAKACQGQGSGELEVQHPIPAFFPVAVMIDEPPS